MKKMIVNINLLLLIFFLSCTNKENIESNKISFEEMTLFYECEEVEILEPYKFDLYDSTGFPITLMPTDIKYDTFRDRLIVLDTKKFQILILSPEGELLQEIGRQGEAVSEFISPGSFSYDINGNIYIIDIRKVEIYDSTGNEIRSFLPKYNPSQIMVEDTNSIYILIATSTNDKVLAKYNINGDLLGEYINKVEVEHQHPSEKIMLEMLANQTTMTMDSDKNIYVAFANEYRIVKMDINGNVDYNYITKEMPFEIIKPHIPKDSTDRIMNIIIMDISIDAKGNLYILWGENFGEPYSRIDVYDKKGNQIKVLKLSIPYSGEGKGWWYISPIGRIDVFSNYIFATECFAEGMIYRYDIGM